MTFVDWLKTSIPGIIILGATGSLLAAGALYLMRLYSRYMFKLGFKHGFIGGFVEGKIFSTNDLRSLIVYSIRSLARFLFYFLLALSFFTTGVIVQLLIPTSLSLFSAAILLIIIGFFFLRSFDYARRLHKTSEHFLKHLYKEAEDAYKEKKRNTVEQDAAANP